MDRKKDLKGIVYLFDSLRILFSYNLSAIKRGFSFFISSISVVCFCYLCEGIVCSIKQIIWLITAKREYFKHRTWEGNAHLVRQSSLLNTSLSQQCCPAPRKLLPQLQLCKSLRHISSPLSKVVTQMLLQLVSN